MALTPLAAKLAARIATEGPISFHDYMAACLYDAEFGYYTRAAAIGKSGDFITAPEISQVFGELIGLWAGEMWRHMGSPPGLRLIELGPGRGTLMADALRALRVLPGFLETVSVHLVETSATLREQQRQKLERVPCAVSWHAAVEDVPLGPSIVVANEFVDCLPVAQFIFDGVARTWRERSVDFQDGRFLFAAGKSRAALAAAPEKPENGTIVEGRPSVTQLMTEFAGRAAHGPFAAAVIDYGYERPSFGDTVQAVRRHRYCGVFDAPGEMDLTAHVDFAHLKSESEDAGLKAFGPMPMGEWLLRLGAHTRAAQLLESASQPERASIQTAIARLVDPAQMGVLFKVVSLMHGISRAPLLFI